MAAAGVGRPRGVASEQPFWVGKERKTEFLFAKELAETNDDGFLLAQTSDILVVLDDREAASENALSSQLVDRHGGAGAVKRNTGRSEERRGSVLADYQVIDTLAVLVHLVALHDRKPGEGFGIDVGRQRPRLSVSTGSDTA